MGYACIAGFLKNIKWFFFFFGCAWNSIKKGSQIINVFVYMPHPHREHKNC